MTLRIHKLVTNADQSIDVMYHGNSTDYDYIAGCLKNRKGITVSKVEHKSNDIFDVLRVRGTEANPVTDAGVLAMLGADQHIEIKLASGATDTDLDASS